jgi:hypothetical protein
MSKGILYVLITRNLDVTELLNLAVPAVQDPKHWSLLTRIHN